QELTEEERRISKALATAPSSPMSVDQPLPPPGAPAPTTPATSPLAPTNSAARRGSTISLSSLNRTPFPHKLDLSSVRGPADDILALSSGLSSPVTLAPKSARPMSSAEYANDIMAALTSSSSDPSQAPLSAAMGGPPSAQMGPPPPPQPSAMDTIDLTGDLDVPGPGDVGGSAEKPIELDLDGMDLGMSMDMQMDILGGQGAGGEKTSTEQGQEGNAPDAAMFDLTSFGEGASAQKSENEPSPGSLLAQFQSSDGQNAADSTNDLFGDAGGENTNIDFGAESFDMGDMNMMDFSDMGNLGDLLGNMGGGDGAATAEQQPSDTQQPPNTAAS
ncbi:hypothetical protein HDZ31DRAFT_50531, partial [Schizophyllum fasciatum]